jgi:uncharacterized coiled-coil protein SlyX
MFGDAKLRKRVSELEESLARIEHSFKQLQVEWTETYDKFRQLHWRVAKRAKQLEEANAETEAAADSSPPGELVASDSATGFSHAQLLAQQKVLARRNRKLADGRNGGG